MKKFINIKSLIVLAYFVIAIISLYSVVYYRKEIANSVNTSINYSFNMLIPSLFPMIFISSFISCSPASNIISFLFSFICKKVFKLPECCACAIFFGICCGYPVGAKLTSKLLEDKKINKEEANRLLCFCVNAGIPFAVIFVGCGVFSSLKMGLFFFVSNTIASLLIGIIMGIKKKIPTKSKNLFREYSFNDCVSISAKSSLLATVNLCLYVMIFSCFIQVLRASGFFEFLVSLFSKISVFSNAECSGIIAFFFDVVAGVNSSQMLSLNSNIFILGLSFAGLCVHFQIFSFFQKGSISFKKFYFSRIIHAFLSYEIFGLLKHFFPSDIAVFSSTENIIPKISQNNAPLTVCLILLICTYIFSNKRLEKKTKL